MYVRVSGVWKNIAQTAEGERAEKERTLPAPVHWPGSFNNPVRASAWLARGTVGHETECILSFLSAPRVAMACLPASPVEDVSAHFFDKPASADGHPSTFAL